MAFQYLKGPHSKDGDRLSTRACSNSNELMVLNGKRIDLDQI